jgi:hypothetical protein
MLLFGEFQTKICLVNFPLKLQNWFKKYWKSTCDYSVEKKTLKKTVMFKFYALHFLQLIVFHRSTFSWKSPTQIQSDVYLLQLAPFKYIFTFQKNLESHITQVDVQRKINNRLLFISFKQSFLQFKQLN